MRIALALVPETVLASGPDLTRYFLVCALTILALLAALWLFRRFVAERLKARAAKRSMRVLDVLPLSGKQKLVVVRCYDRSFLLGLGEKEVRMLAELDAETEPAALTPASQSPARFSESLASELVLTPEKAPARPRATAGMVDPRGGFLA